ncbi:hypothetical protein FAGAP_7869 [Fusarium agapanthi]|uniref:Uncharacterized protein n=1 Tax=Fusarium agapanthi TaxID=1803897 RepID=A0A9P5E5E3_9HYPO|nr:hypothetical protein FAGAP_7869 [Fusarium agapanthi]
MGGYTVECALCCAPIHDKHRENQDPLRDVDHGRDSGHDIDKAWMEEFMIIARDPETQDTFMIEQAQHHRDNIFDVHDDEEVANHGEAFDSRLVTVYDCEGPQAFAAPFHVDCYKVLADAYEPRDVGLSALYDTLESHCPSDDGVYRIKLAFDYDMPRHNVVGTPYDFSFASPNRVSDDSMFVGAELKRNSRRSGSRCALHILNGERLTPTRIYDDVPWAKYILPVRKHKPTIDMAIYYKNLVALGNGFLKEGDFTLPVRMHLQNRCRIWGVCTRLLEECSTRGQSANKTETETKEQGPLIKHTKQADKILEGAIASPMPLLTFPGYSKKVYDSVSLIKEMKDLEKAQPVIRVYWSAKRRLAGIGVYDPTQTRPRPWDQRVWRRVIVGIKFVFLYDDFISLGEPVGDVRVLVPKPWHTVVGIGASWNEGKGVESLVLLQQHQEKVLRSAYCRVGMEYPDDLDGLSVTKMFRPDPRIANFLWRGWIPCRPEIWPTYPVRLDPLMPTPVDTLMLTKPRSDDWD